jgi:hypothetical protein
MIESWRMGMACSMHGSNTDASRVLVERAEGKRPLRRHKWENNIKMGLMKIGY